ncbi:MAG: TnpV protein [Lachnospiraceae bacterium]|nr:TnpV protein [Lachnospiraceae bacterium]MDD3617738.1 TnpV protein [Lachnospiraceae bacterium]
MKKHIIGENGIGYTLAENEIYYPDLETTDYQIGKYGRMRQKYLKEHHKAAYSKLLLNGELNEHLHNVDVECKQRMEVLVRQMQERQGVTEQLKAENQMQWVGMMNNIRQAAEEVVLKENIYY